jgi:hypothetical protein
LFDAVVRGDIGAIEQLTVKQPVGKQVRQSFFCCGLGLTPEKVHVCCFSSISRRNPVMLAVELNKPDVAKALVQIAIEQFTPLQVPKKKKDDKVPLINNYELANLMRQFKVCTTLLKVNQTKQQHRSLDHS